jgi:hypothetical protein
MSLRLATSALIYSEDSPSPATAVPVCWRAVARSGDADNGPRTLLAQGITLHNASSAAGHALSATAE